MLWVLFFLVVPIAYAASFGCEIRTSCNANETLLVRLNSSETADTPNNSHIQLANHSGSAYPYSVCCWTDSFRTLSNTCEAESTVVLKLEDTTNSHVQAATQSGYAWDACYNVTTGSVECEYPNSACSAGYNGVVSMASSEPADNNLTNAHLADFNEYLRKVCCRIGGQTPPAVDHANLTPINATTRLDLHCGNGSVTDADGDAVTLHYNWLRNGTSITVLNMPMDYDSGTGVTHDISSFANHGSVSGATFLPIDGQIGSAFSFDGSADNITVGNDAELNFGVGNFSIAAWIFRDEEVLHDIMDKTDASTANNGYRIFGQIGLVRFAITNGSVSAATSADASGGVWHHIVGIRSGTNVSLYVDGAYANSVDSGTVFNVSGDEILTLGSSSGGQNPFAGRVDEVMIFNRSLTAQEIKTLYNTNNAYWNATELQRGDTWNCSITPIDSTGLNGSTVYSNETYVDGSIPTVPTLLYPADGNQTVFERILNFNWTSSDERDNDAVTYQFNLSVTAGSCAVETGQTGIAESNYTFGELCLDQLYWWNVTACDDIEGCSSTTSTFNFTVASVLSITMLNNNTAFGTIAIGGSRATDTDGVEPFVIQNNGNVKVNITLIGNSSPFTSVGLGDEAFQFRVADNETDSFNDTGSQVTYVPVPATWAHAVRQLNYSDSQDEVRIHINVTAPTDEPPGQKQGNITFQAEGS